MENTPYYFYDLDLLNRTLNEVSNCISNTDFKVHYAVKANSNKEVLKQISKKGLGADCVSGTEIRWALESGFSPSEIVFAGVGKTDAEIIYALDNKIGMINCESLEEVVLINELAKERNRKVPIAIRINPNVNANTHAKITTGLVENKFGFTALEFEDLCTVYPLLEFVDIQGMHFHIGSQITNMEVFKSLCVSINNYIPIFTENIGRMTYLNVGGGLGIDYYNPDENEIPDFANYFQTFENYLKLPALTTVHFELGRSIVGQCGSLRTKVLFVKRSANKNFAILDAGMTELMRPALYNAYHKVEKLNDLEEERSTYDLVGPICESSDCFGENIELPLLKRGDIITIRSCGAYAESMSLNYNGRGRIRSEFSGQKAPTIMKKIAVLV